MRTVQRYVLSLGLAAMFASPLMISGCAEHAQYRVYDRDHNDYHEWNSNENVYYVQWENETHHKHKDFRKRSDDEQREYWNWRHGHDHDHDHDQH